MIPSISISDFDNSFTDNRLSVHQTNDCDSAGNLGHLLRKPTGPLAHSTQTFIPLPPSHWNMVSETNVHTWRSHWYDTEIHNIAEVIFLDPWSSTGKNTEGFQSDCSSDLNNAKCLLLRTQEALDAKWLGWQSTADEMICRKSISMFPFSHCVLAVHEWSAGEVHVFSREIKMIRDAYWM